MTIEDVEAAPAKVNLALHVTGRRDDGYHLLDTLVMHGGAADRVALRAVARAASTTPHISLTLDGPFAEGLEVDDGNLVIRAARLLAGEAARLGRPVFDVDLRLEKNLSVASGIGGGSSDAAATLRLLDRVWGLGLGRARLAELSLPLGADVPMCVWGEPLRARGIGLVLVNPGVAVSTPAVFRALTSRENPPLSGMPERFADVDALVGWLESTRNDLQDAAIEVAPVIGDVLGWLEAQPGCRFARMSGSGATCFAVFAEGAPAMARAPAAWWVSSAV